MKRYRMTKNVQTLYTNAELVLNPDDNYYYPKVNDTLFRVPSSYIPYFIERGIVEEIPEEKWATDSDILDFVDDILSMHRFYGNEIHKKELLKNYKQRLNNGK
jgi:hypothetical protein